MRAMNGNEINGEAVTESKLLASGYRKYRGKAIDIYFNRSLCTHSGNCIRGNSAVFDVGRKPWILADNASADEDMEVIDTCPSGALKYLLKAAFQWERKENAIVALCDGKQVGEITWSNAGKKLWIIDHTFVASEARGHGLAAKLVFAVVEQARNEGKKILPLCPFAKKEFEQQEEYRDVWYDKTAN